MYIQIAVSAFFLWQYSEGDPQAQGASAAKQFNAVVLVL